MIDQHGMQAPFRDLPSEGDEWTAIPALVKRLDGNDRSTDFLSVEYARERLLEKLLAKWCDHQ